MEIYHPAEFQNVQAIYNQFKLSSASQYKTAKLITQLMKRVTELENKVHDLELIRSFKN
jgi:hypothetical protein